MKKSEIHGLGLYATKEIPKQTKLKLPIKYYLPAHADNHLVLNLLEENSNDILILNPNNIMLGLFNASSYLNHSESNNAKVEYN